MLNTCEVSPVIPMSQSPRLVGGAHRWSSLPKTVWPRSHVILVGFQGQFVEPVLEGTTFSNLSHPPSEDQRKPQTASLFSAHKDTFWETHNIEYPQSNSSTSELSSSVTPTAPLRWPPASPGGPGTLPCLYYLHQLTHQNVSAQWPISSKFLYAPVLLSNLLEPG